MSDSASESESESSENGTSPRVHLRMSSSGESSGNEVDIENATTMEVSRDKPLQSKDPRRALMKASARTKNPPFFDMVTEALSEVATGQKGASIPAIKAEMRKAYDISEASMKRYFRKQMEKGLKDGVFIRPVSSKDNKGLTGRFKINPEWAKAKRKASKQKATKSHKEDGAKKSKRAVSVKSSKRKSAAPKIDKEKLTSLKTSSSVKMAKEKIRLARKSIGLAQTAKRKVATKKIARQPTDKKQGDDSKSTKEKSKTASQNSKSKKTVETTNSKTKNLATTENSKLRKKVGAVDSKTKKKGKASAASVDESKAGKLNVKKKSRKNTVVKKG